MVELLDYIIVVPIILFVISILLQLLCDFSWHDYESERDLNRQSNYNKTADYD